MKALSTLTLAVAVAAAALVPALAPTSCPAQEKKGDPAAAEGEKPARPLVARIYDIAGIRTPRIVTTLKPADADHLRPFGISPGLYNDLADDTVTAPEAHPGADDVGELLRAFLPRAVGEDSKFTSVWDGAAIRVVTTDEGQKIVAAALESLRLAAVPFQFDVRSVTLRDDTESAAILAELDRLDGAQVPATLVERLLSSDTHGGLRGGTVCAFGGVTTRLDRIETRSIVANWDVEIAQSASIADPVPAMVEDGLRAMLNATQTSDGGRALVRFSATSGDLQRPIRRVEMRTKDLGTVEMPELRGGFVSTEWLAQTGATTAIVLASPVSSVGGATGSVREVLLVKLVSAPPAREQGAVTLVPIGSLSNLAQEAVLVAPALEPSSDDLRGCLLTWWDAAPPRVEAQELERLARATDPGAADVNWNIAALGLGWPGGASLAVTGTDAFRSNAVALAASFERDMLRGAHVSVRLAARDAAGTSEKVLGTVSAPAMTGRNLALAAYASVPYIGDYDVEVAQEARIADPRTLVALGGIVLNVRLAQGPADGWRADVDLAVSSVGAVESAPVSATEVGLIERCPIKRTRASQPVILENGKSKEIDLGANPWGPGRLVAVIRVNR
ncbi:MAG: hypothetical protein K8T90_19895 [Planctomycetes bacterium]|nr:hypothetical protein [Planctomycetota bacterium]